MFESLIQDSKKKKEKKTDWNYVLNYVDLAAFAGNFRPFLARIQREMAYFNETKSLVIEMENPAISHGIDNAFWNCNFHGALCLTNTSGSAISTRGLTNFTPVLTLGIRERYIVCNYYSSAKKEQTCCFTRCPLLQNEKNSTCLTFSHHSKAKPQPVRF